MITIRNSFPMPVFAGELPDSIYFDIETTGLSASDSCLYMIGCCYRNGADFELIQWFSEGLSDEIRLLEAFSEKLSSFHTLIHYNGSGFDLPYLAACAKQYHKSYAFRTEKDIDLYRQIRHLSRILALPHYNLKSAEAFFGIGRTDEKDGGELIEVYERYLEKKDPDDLKLLLLHNFEDIKNLPFLHRAISALYHAEHEPYQLFVEASDPKENTPVSEAAAMDELKKYVPLLNFTLYYPDLSFPMDILAQNAPALAAPVLYSGHKLTFCLPIVYGELLLFYDNYKDYYYLPAEDMAIHKSLAAFVDKSHKKKATASTCYTRKEGTFLQIPEAVAAPDFRLSYKGKEHFLLLGDEPPSDVILRQIADSVLRLLYPASKSSL